MDLSHPIETVSSKQQLHKKVTPSRWLWQPRDHQALERNIYMNMSIPPPNPGSDSTRSPTLPPHLSPPLHRNPLPSEQTIKEPTDSQSRVHNGHIIRTSPTITPHNSNLANKNITQLMKAAFPIGFISQEPGSASSLSANSTGSAKSLLPAGDVNKGNDTYKMYSGDGSKGWPSMDEWVDFYSM